MSSHSSRAPGCVCPPLGASVCVCPRFQSFLWEGEECETSRQAEEKVRGGRCGGVSRGRGNRPGEEERRKEAALAARGGGGAESLDWEPRARLGSGRGGAAGTAALPAWAESRDTGLAGTRQPQVGRVWDGGENLTARV